MLERVREEINRRTRVAGLFPNQPSLLRLAGDVLMKLSEEWETGKRYLNMDVENDDSASEQNRIYRKKVVSFLLEGTSPNIYSRFLSSRILPIIVQMNPKILEKSPIP